MRILWIEDEFSQHFQNVPDFTEKETEETDITIYEQKNKSGGIEFFCPHSFKKIDDLYENDEQFYDFDFFVLDLNLSNYKDEPLFLKNRIEEKREEFGNNNPFTNNANKNIESSAIEESTSPYCQYENDNKIVEEDFLQPSITRDEDYNPEDKNEIQSEDISRKDSGKDPHDNSSELNEKDSQNKNIIKEAGFWYFFLLLEKGIPIHKIMIVTQNDVGKDNTYDAWIEKFKELPIKIPPKISKNISDKGGGEFNKALTSIPTKIEEECVNIFEDVILGNNGFLKFRRNSISKLRELFRELEKKSSVSDESDTLFVKSLISSLISKHRLSLRDEKKYYKEFLWQLAGYFESIPYPDEINTPNFNGFAIESFKMLRNILAHSGKKEVPLEINYIAYFINLFLLYKKNPDDNRNTEKLICSCNEEKIIKDYMDIFPENIYNFLKIKNSLYNLNYYNILQAHILGNKDKTISYIKYVVKYLYHYFYPIKIGSSYTYKPSDKPKMSINMSLKVDNNEQFKDEDIFLFNKLYNEPTTKKLLEGI